MIALRSAFLSAQKVRDAYLGYAAQQFRKLIARGDDGRSCSHGAPGKAAKHARHLMRLVDQGLELYTTGSVTIRLADPQRYFDFGERRG